MKNRPTITPSWDEEQALAIRQLAKVRGYSSLVNRFVTDIVLRELSAAEAELNGTLFAKVARRTARELAKLQRRPGYPGIRVPGEAESADPEIRMPGYTEPVDPGTRIATANGRAPIGFSTGTAPATRARVGSRSQSMYRDPHAVLSSRSIDRQSTPTEIENALGSGTENDPEPWRHRLPPPSGGDLALIASQLRRLGVDPGEATAAASRFARWGLERVQVCVGRLLERPDRPKGTDKALGYLWATLNNEYGKPSNRKRGT